MTTRYEVIVGFERDEDTEGEAVRAVGALLASHPRAEDDALIDGIVHNDASAGLSLVGTAENATMAQVERTP